MFSLITNFAGSLLGKLGSAFGLPSVGLKPINTLLTVNLETTSFPPKAVWCIAICGLGRSIQEFMLAMGKSAIL